MALSESEELELLELEAEAAKSEGKEKATYQQPTYTPDLGDVASQAVAGAGSEALMRSGSAMRGLMSDPVTQAKALPPLAGLVGAISPVIGGATMGTVGGRQLSNAALRAYGKPEEIPSATSQVVEGLTAAAGDVLAIPAIKRAHYGGKIGAAEGAAGVVTRAPDRLPTAGSVGEYMTNLEAQIDSGVLNTPQAARDAVAGMRYINQNPNIVGKSSDIAVQAARVGAKAQKILNATVPGRAEPAQALAKSQAIPNFISHQWGKIPSIVRKGIIPLGVLEEYMRRRHGG